MKLDKEEMELVALYEKGKVKILPALPVVFLLQG